MTRKKNKISFKKIQNLFHFFAEIFLIFWNFDYQNGVKNYKNKLYLSKIKLSIC